MIPEEIQIEIDAIKSLLSAQLVMAQRTYDLLAALLAHFDSERNDAIFDAHDQGGLFNPALIVPDYERQDLEG